MDRCFHAKINLLQPGSFSPVEFGVIEHESSGLYCIDESESGDGVSVEGLSRIGDTSFSPHVGFVNVHIIIVIT